MRLHTHTYTLKFFYDKKRLAALFGRKKKAALPSTRKTWLGASWFSPLFFRIRSLRADDLDACHEQKKII